jgi:trehalose 6-phosphate synthase/phosphatase
LGPHRRSTGIWIGWPGETQGVKRAQRRALGADLADRGLVPVHLGRREVDEFYDGISNGILWPVLQYLIDRVPISAPGWDTYRSVNQRFARAVIDQYQEGDLIWVHDYHLFLVPQLIREQLPKATIGFFLHIPFPAEDVFGVLPWREEILRGILGSDLIGFHTAGYLRHFVASLRRFLRLEPTAETVTFDGRVTRLGVFPIGVDTASWRPAEDDTSTRERIAEIKREAGDRHILLGIDRLDFTKGILRRLAAFERLLERDPSLADQVRFIQVTVPTREKSPAYDAFRRQVDELVGRINGVFATANSVPIYRLHRSLDQAELLALYRAADVMLVTSLRDGMNLVSKEFIASRTDDDGVLILSEFAGAADELGDALIVNPYDIDEVAATIERALMMPATERAERMRAMREHVNRYDVHRWARSFLSAVEGTQASPPRRTTPATPCRLDSAIEALASAEHKLIALDYDGTIVPFADEPDDARPDGELVRLIEGLSAQPDTTLHIVSGRSRESLERWFGHLGLGLHAEHGLWSRFPDEGNWRQTQAVSSEWKETIRPLMEQFAGTTQGSFVEEKSSALVWHYRKAHNGHLGEEFVEARARELRTLLTELLADAPLQVTASKKVVEVRPLAVNKGLLLEKLLSAAPAGVRVLAFGDDQTDEDMFVAAPADALTVRVGEGPTNARFTIPDFTNARALLRKLLAADFAGWQSGAPSG